MGPVRDELDQRLDQALGAVRQLSSTEPAVGVVLGSGLGAFVDELAEPVMLSYGQIPHMPRPGVSGHAGRLAIGTLSGVPVACLQGRSHLYEAHTPDSVVFGVRLLARLGCRLVLLTNAAGGVGADLVPGDLMLVVDHVNLTAQNPLVGLPGPPFIDMTDAYDPRLRACAHRAARDAGVTLKEGIYAGMLGPSYETAAEVRMLASLGVHAVGMSTVLEAIALRQVGVAVGAVSAITNAAAGRDGAILDHAHVQRIADSVRDRLTRLLRGWIRVSVNELGRRPGSTPT
jgi:purine-nucleoside phosphorylase